MKLANKNKRGVCGCGIFSKKGQNVVILVRIKIRNGVVLKKCI